jgi:hypothetical protein
MNAFSATCTQEVMRAHCNATISSWLFLLKQISCKEIRGEFSQQVLLMQAYPEQKRGGETVNIIIELFQRQPGQKGLTHSNRTSNEAQ